MLHGTAGRCVATLLFLASLAVPGWAAEPAAIGVSEAPTAGAFPLVTAPSVAAIAVDEREAKVVRIAADLLAADIERVTGRRPTMGRAAGTSAADATVIVGTLGAGGVIDALADSGKLDASAVKGKWEAYALALVADPTPGVRRALVIAGSDRRGTAYGAMALSEAIGVSPWYWWADVPPRRRPALYINLPAPVRDAPGVKYRGIFINDEDWGLQPWAAKTFDPALGNIGPKTYERIFELMLRLRLNYFWPAMHACSTEFGAIPANVALADDWGIVAGASHCEPMLYNNVHWDSQKSGPWNYSTNRDAVHAAWAASAKARGNAEAVWTLGIRGVHDAAMEAPPRDTPGKLKVLTDVIRDERALLDRYVTRRWGPVAQCFVPYKEVLTVYDAGLKVPDDVTLVWTDDNFGYIRRLSSPAERKRGGGSGVYYHLSYYGQPHSYTWVNTTPPALIWEELHKAWANDARALWVLNVGDLKPAEIGIDYYARLAWNPEKFGPDSQPHFLRAFAERNFGAAVARPMADLLGDFYRLGTIHKPELMDREWAMSLSPETAARLERQYHELLAREQALAATIPADARDAYTQTVGFPARVLGTCGLIFMADRKAQHGADAAARQAEIARLRAELQAQVETFNQKLAGGKWNHVMPGLVTGKYLPQWSSQVRWPWGEPPATQPSSAPRPAATRRTSAATQPAGRARRPERPPAPRRPAEPDRSWRDAAAADRNIARGAARWTVVEGLGQSGRAVSLEPASLSSAWEAGDASAPSLEFDFTTARGGDAQALIDFLPTFRIYPGMKLRVAVSLDDAPPAAIQVPGSGGAEDERGAVRTWGVQDNAVRASVPLTGLSAGKHTLRVAAVDPGAVVDRVSLP